MRKFKIFLGVAFMATVLTTSCNKYVEVTGIKLSETAITVEMGEWYTLTATISPKNATNKTVVWLSTSPYAAVADGVVFGQAVGKGTIIAKAGNYTATCEVTVVKTIAVTSIKLDKTSLSMLVGKTEKLTATILPANATNKTVTWTSSNDNVATVSTNGTVTSKALGSATITAKAGDKTATCAVTVSDVNSVTLNKTSLSLFPNETETLTATTNPAGGAITWTSSNASVASVSTNGKVTANVAGSATISAKSGNKTANCAVTVKSLNGGVLINGRVWATRNVDNFRTFASAPESAGKFYQYNRTTAWAATGSVSGWDNSYTTSTTWSVANDPCPNGWRVPARVELESLGTGVWTTQNGTYGRIFGTAPNQIFLPAVGYRDNGTLKGVGEQGFYWSSTGFNDTYCPCAYCLIFYSYQTNYTYTYRNVGCPVRCVAQ